MITQRSQEKELLDLGPDYYSSEEYAHCMEMLFRVNKFLGFFSGTVRLLKQFPKNSSLVDIGCGGGLFLLHLHKHFPLMQLIGQDISHQAIELAQQQLQVWQKKIAGMMNISFQWQSSGALTLPKNSVDIILATMVCHHLTDHELIEFLRQAITVARSAVIINDLQRSSLAQRLYALISPLLFQNRLITHDGLISIRRGFTRTEWHLIMSRANIKNYEIKWCFPFRWRIVIRTREEMLHPIDG